jgi:hypothetical protein
MLKHPITNEFVIPRRGIRNEQEKTNWFYKDGIFSLIGYILHHYFEVPLQNLDGHVCIHHVSRQTGEEYKGLSKYVEKEERQITEEWMDYFWKCKSIEQQMMCLSNHTGYKCSFEKPQEIDISL